MLVLSRQRDETIMIGDDIEITVVDIRGDKVRLGISAPTAIAVHRKEVYDAIRSENERAARLAAPDVKAIGQTIATGPERAAARARAAELVRPLDRPAANHDNPRPESRPSNAVPPRIAQ